MFKHIYIYRMKCLLRDRMMIFWTVLFPMVLATFFTMAFSNISSGSAFTSIPVAVVGQQEGGGVLNEALEAAQGDSGKLFAVAHVSKQQADQMLEDGTISGYILFDGGAQVVIKESGYNQTILKEFVDSVLQSQSAYTRIITQNPAAAEQLKAPGIRGYIRQDSAQADSNIIITYFYALIGMAAVYGTFWGNREIMDIQADMSGTGARINLAPVHKLKAFFYSACAAVTIHFASLMLLIAFMTFVLGVDFSGHIPQLALVCLAGSVAGVSLGALLGMLTGKNERAKNIISISVSMGLSFLAGLMVNSVKITVNNAVPLLGYINPANLISDALYSLFYSTYTRFYLNIGLLLGLSAIFILAVYLVARRKKYASI